MPGEKDSCFVSACAHEAMQLAAGVPTRQCSWPLERANASAMAYHATEPMVPSTGSSSSLQRHSGGYFNQLGRYLGSPRSQHGHQCQSLVWRPNGQHGYGLWQLNCMPQERHGAQEWHRFVLVNKLEYCFTVDTEMVNKLGLPVCPLPTRTWERGCDMPL